MKPFVAGLVVSLAAAFSTTSASAVQCEGNSFNGGLPAGVNEITIAASDINSVSTSNFSISTIEHGSSDNASQGETYLKFTLGSGAMQELDASSITLSSGTKVSASFGGAVVEAVCD